MRSNEVNVVAGGLAVGVLEHLRLELEGRADVQFTRLDDLVETRLRCFSGAARGSATGEGECGNCCAGDHRPA
jgi:hypothetical protein